MFIISGNKILYFEDAAGLQILRSGEKNVHRCFIPGKTKSPLPIGSKRFNAA